MVVLSRVKGEAVTDAAAKRAAGLLEAAGLHGHEYATVAKTALRRPGPVALLTSDLDDTSRLRSGRTQLVGA